MARIGINYQDVATAATTVQGRDQVPTVDRIRAVLGTGSKSTIARYLKEWKSKTNHIPGSDDIPQEIIGLIKGLWERLKNEADQKISIHEQEANKTIAEMSAALNTEQKTNVSLQSDLRNIEEKLHLQINLFNSLQRTLEEEKRAYIAIYERNNALSQKTDEQKSENDRLHQLLSHLQANLEHYQDSMQKLREEQTLNHEKQKIQYEQEIQSLKKLLSDETNQNNYLYRELDQIKHALNQKDQQLNKLTEERNIFQQQVQEKQLSEVAIQNRYDQLHQTSLNYQKMSEEQADKILSHEKKIAVLIDKIENLNHSLETSHDTIRILRDEKLFLAQEKSLLEGQLKQLQKMGINHVV